MDTIAYFLIIGAIFLGIYNLMAIGIKHRGYKNPGQVKRDSWKEMQKEYPVKFKVYEINKRSWKKSKAKYFK